MVDLSHLFKVMGEVSWEENEGACPVLGSGGGKSVFYNKEKESGYNSNREDDNDGF